MSKYTEIEVLGKAAREFWEVSFNAANRDDHLSVKARETATRCAHEAGILLLSVSEDREVTTECATCGKSLAIDPITTAPYCSRPCVDKALDASVSR